MRPYLPANVRAQPYPAWRVVALAWAGKFLGVQFKIDGIPYGAYAYPPEADLPDWDDLRGRAPDATGGLSSEAFVRELRDGWR